MWEGQAPAAIMASFQLGTLSGAVQNFFLMCSTGVVLVPFTGRVAHLPADLPVRWRLRCGHLRPGHHLLPRLQVHPVCGLQVRRTPNPSNLGQDKLSASRVWVKTAFH